MLNLLGKSVKTLNSGITNLVSNITSENSYKTEIEFCKFDVLNLNLLKATEKDTNTSVNNANHSFVNDSETNFKEFNVFYLVHSKVFLSIYWITDDLEIKCIFTNKFSFQINSVDSFFLPLTATYTKELPIIGLISNYSNYSLNNASLSLYGGSSLSPSNNININQNHENIHKYTNTNSLLQKTESHLKLYSIKSKRVIHNFRFKKKILQFISKLNYFAVSFADGSIKLFENDKMKNFWTINTIPFNTQPKDIVISKNTSSNNITNTLLSSSLSNNFNLKTNKNNDGNNTHNTHNNQNSYYMYSTPIFDISDTYIVYYNTTANTNTTTTTNNNNLSTTTVNKNDTLSNTSNSTMKSNYNSEKMYKKINISNKTSHNTNNITNIPKTFSPIKNTYSHTYTQNPNTIENLASEVYTNISKLKDWSVSQIKDLSNLRNASNFKNNVNILGNNNLSNTQNNNTILSGNYSISKGLNKKVHSTLVLQKVIFDDNFHLSMCNEEREVIK
jgi:hypothetical protein